MLFIAIIVFASVYLCLFSRINDANGRIALLEIKANYSEKSEKTLRESVDLQTKCIRDLNYIVKKSVGNKEPTEPDTKALLAGWIVEEPEPPKEEQPRPIDIFRMQKLISSLHCKNITPIYPRSQVELNPVLGPYEIREEWMK
jgi:hypothetical protein